MKFREDRPFASTDAALKYNSVAVKATIERDYMTMHPGGYMSFTQARADLFARSRQMAINCCEGGRLRLEWAFVALELSNA